MVASNSQGSPGTIKPAAIAPLPSMTTAKLHNSMTVPLKRSASNPAPMAATGRIQNETVPIVAASTSS